ncbi:MAG: aminoglycoside phosphotransferase family protein [Bacillota bacterium]|nr:aminoglycoside phosphotransferase family protein [Bacillota bacterium]
MPEAAAEQRRSIPLRFAFEGELQDLTPNYGEGHINDTVLVRCRLADGTLRRYILQRINQHVFREPEGLMENIVAVTSWLREKARANGGDPSRETLTVIPTKDGANWLVDESGEYWRCYDFVEDTVTLQAARSPEDLKLAGRSFGRFMSLLDDFPAEKLHVTIPRFHDTVHRYEQVMDALKADPQQRGPGCRDEIAFVEARYEHCSWLLDRLADGSLPLRVTHNDTKLNNILFDATTGEGICVVDLDTVMPGLAAYDFGDAVRFGASTAAEDERDLSRVHFSLELFRAYAEGFLEVAGGVIDEIELESLAWGARLITLTIGMRFLADHLNGDVYFKISRPGHNLDRARTQFKLVQDIEAHWDELLAILREAHAASGKQGT